MKMQAVLLLHVVLVFFTAPVIAIDNGVGLTPALGWSSWSIVENDINETYIKGIADAFVTSGLRDAGFMYINLDAGAWLPSRTANGLIQVDRSKFPGGMKALADYIHSKGLKLGLYTDLSNREVGFVCGTGPGSYGNFDRDAATFAEIGYDFLKVDFCSYDQKDPKHFVPSVADQQQYWAEVRDAVNKTGRPVHLYACPRSLAPRGDAPPLNWTAAMRRGLANSMLTEHRNARDSWESFLSNLDALLTLTDFSYSGPGFWQDGDMLNSCNFGKAKFGGGGGMTHDEYTAQFATWAILASNMILSNDIPSIQKAHPECLRMLLNAEIIAVNQDLGGHPPRLVFKQVVSELHAGGPGGDLLSAGFSRTLHDGSQAVVLLNTGEKDATLGVTWLEIGLAAGKNCSIRDLIGRKDLGSATSFDTSVRMHTVAMVKITCPRGNTFQYV